MPRMEWNTNASLERDKNSFFARPHAFVQIIIRKKPRPQKATTGPWSVAASVHAVASVGGSIVGLWCYSALGFGRYHPFIRFKYFSFFVLFF
jgi:hypothetical protein